MSSRRGVGEENILAMLERDSARRPGTRMSGVRLASYGAAAALAGILAGGIAWLAYDNHRTAQELQVQHDLAIVAAPPMMADAAVPPSVPPAAVTAPAPVMEAPRTAVINDESARGRDATLASAPPPLVMLPPHELAGAKPPPAAAAPRPVQESVRPKPVKSETAPAAARPAAQKKVDKAPKLASRAVKSTPARSAGPAKARLEGNARPRKVAPSADAPVDSDVALISAIIQHSERHRGERDAAGACSGPKCPPKPTRP
ncbi:hypothetical protein ACHAC9_18135 [Massilia sp. CMS3.1]|uniref:hypothetical protein n=1 Tax=Massilia sp. CMS3.1 TaxID=3373083 RepID=UPI003EE6A0EC